MERLSAILEHLEANSSHLIVYVQGKDLTVSFFHFYDQGKKVCRIRVTSLMKIFSLTQSNKNNKTNNNYHNNDLSSKARIIEMSRATHLVVKCLLTFKQVTFILFFHTIFYLPLEIMQ